MPKKTSAEPFHVSASLRRAWQINNRINKYLIENLDDRSWLAKPAKGRTVAAICAHIHNVRLMWLKSAEPSAALPPKLGEEELTREAVIAALEQSAKALEEVLNASLEGDGTIRGFRPDAAGFFAYLIAHDAHHRGQVSMLARQLGFPLSPKVNFGMWEWGTR